MYLKNNKGVTLLALTITITVMMIITGTVIYNYNSHIKIEKVNKLYNDIENINTKIEDYYLKYGDIPTLGESYCTKTELEGLLDTNRGSSTLNTVDNVKTNPNDGDEYYIIDLEKLDGLILNYGYGTDTGKYIINKVTHQIYYPNGIIVGDYMYYTYNLNSNFVEYVKLAVDYDYTGKVETSSLKAGTYKLQVWGAQGGDASEANYGGKGGYSVGTLTLSKDTTVYIYVGGQGVAKESTYTGEVEGGFNGGGSAYQSSTGLRTSGGGASDIRIGQDSLYARVIVAGGGGGNLTYKTSEYTAGAGGGLTGTDGTVGKGGTQTAGGTGYSSFVSPGFGYGGHRSSSSTNTVAGGGGRMVRRRLWKCRRRRLWIYIYIYICIELSDRVFIKFDILFKRCRNISR